MKCEICNSLEFLYDTLCYACFTELHDITA